MRKFMRTREPAAPHAPLAPQHPPPLLNGHTTLPKSNGHANGVGGAARREDHHSTLSSRYWSGSEGSRVCGVAGAGGAPWEDAEFPADWRALGDKRRAHHVVWMRPHELSPRPTFLGEEEEDEEQAIRWCVESGPLGDGGVGAAAAALAHCPRLLARVAPHQSFTQHYTGAFRFRLWVFGSWREVCVDDRLPTRHGRLLAARPARPHDYTLPLLEKACAKAYGSYRAVRGGGAARALQDLTGGVVQSFTLAAQPQHLTFQVLNSAVPRSTLLVATLPLEKEGAVVRADGLVAGQAYCVTGLARVRGAGAGAGAGGGAGALVRVRAGGARVQWRGAWARGSPEWRAMSQPDRDLLAHGPGEFWSDVVQRRGARVPVAGAGARRAGRLAGGAGAAGAAALARRHRAPPLAPRIQRGRPPRLPHHRRQPAVPRAGGGRRGGGRGRGGGSGGAQVPRGGVRHAAVLAARRRRSARHRVRSVRAAPRRRAPPPPRTRPALRPARAGRDARERGARGGDVLHAAAGTVPGGAAHCAPAPRHRLPAQGVHRRAHRRMGGERGQHDHPQPARRVPGGQLPNTRGGARRRRQAARQAQPPRGVCRERGRGGSARRVARRVARVPVRPALARAVPRAAAAARPRHHGASAPAAPARARRAARVLAPRLHAARALSCMRRGRGRCCTPRVRVPAARAAVGRGARRLQQGGGVSGAALRLAPPPPPRALRHGAREAPPRARALPHTRLQDEVQSSLAGRDDPDDDLLMSGARPRSCRVSHVTWRVPRVASRGDRPADTHLALSSCYLLLC